MKTYQSVSIAECHDPLVAIPDMPFVFTRPHPYVALGAPYGGTSPWMLRQRVLDALLAANDALNAARAGWRLQLFDAYRPVAVQAYMVWREFRIQAERAGHTLAADGSPAELEKHDPALYAVLAAKVFEFWGIPSDDPKTPPPHSTGAAIDLTLQDASGREVPMGCPIDETTARAYPDHYAAATEPELRAYDENRHLLKAVMAAAGFSRHANEWWHFSMGDQMWAWATGAPEACYGRAI